MKPKYEQNTISDLVLDDKKHNFIEKLDMEFTIKLDTYEADLLVEILKKRYDMDHFMSKTQEKAETEEFIIEKIYKAVEKRLGK